MVMPALPPGARLIDEEDTSLTGLQGVASQQQSPPQMPAGATALSPVGATPGPAPGGSPPPLPPGATPMEIGRAHV